MPQGFQRRCKRQDPSDTTFTGFASDTPIPYEGLYFFTSLWKHHLTSPAGTSDRWSERMFDIENGWLKRLDGATLPAGSAKEGFLAADGRTVDPAFVEPTLRVLQGDPSTARVIVVAAPGAVGKSTLASAISVGSNAVLVDLAKTEPLGGNFFVGGIANAFGPRALVDLYEGRIALVVDALDEAQLKAGDEGFSAGLLDLTKIISQPDALPATILGRAAAAEEAWLILVEANVDCCLLAIEFFDEQQATKFLQRRLPVLANAREATRKAFERHGPNFIELAIAVRNRLTSTSGGQDKRFSGYAPVLDAICSYALEEDDLNPSARLSELAFEGPIGLIERLSNDILKREQSKLTKQIDDAPTGFDLTSLYSPSEQLARLAAVLFRGAAPTGPHIADPIFRQSYERKVSEFGPQHPFLSAQGGPSSAAFAAFVLVWAITSGTAVQEARRMLSEHPAIGAGLFFELYMNWLNNVDEKKKHSQRQLKLADVGALHASFSTQAARGEVPTLEISGEPGDTVVEITFEMVSATDAENDDSRVYGPYESANDTILEFRGIVGGLNITAPVSVILGDGRNLSITAPVEIAVDDLEIDGREVRVFKSAMTTELVGDEVGLISDKAAVSKVERIATHGAKLAVTFPGAQAHPWSDYFSAPSPAPDERIASLRRRARRILTSFRSHSKGALVRYAKKIEHSRMMKEGPEGRDLLERLKADGILTVFDSGKFYQLHPAQLAEKFRMDYQALQQQKWTDEADAYLSAG